MLLHADMCEGSCVSNCTNQAIMLEHGQRLMAEEVLTCDSRVGKNIREAPSSHSHHWQA